MKRGPTGGRPRSRKGRIGFCLVYLGMMCWMGFELAHNLHHVRGRNLVFALPALAVWGFLFVQIVRLLFRDLRGDQSASHKPAPESGTEARIPAEAAANTRDTSDTERLEWQAFALFGLSAEAGFAEVKRAWREQMKALDPDQFGPEDLASRHRAATKRQELDAAYRVLGKKFGK